MGESRTNLHRYLIEALEKMGTRQLLPAAQGTKALAIALGRLVLEGVGDEHHLPAPVVLYEPGLHQGYVWVPP